MGTEHSLSPSPPGHAAVITSGGCSRGLIFRWDALHLRRTFNYTRRRRGALCADAAATLKDGADCNGCRTRSFFFSSNQLWTRLKNSASSVNIGTLLAAFGNGPGSSPASQQFCRLCAPLARAAQVQENSSRGYECSALCCVIVLLKKQRCHWSPYIVLFSLW